MSETEGLQGDLGITRFTLDDSDQLTLGYILECLGLSGPEPEYLQQLRRRDLAQSEGLAQGVGSEAAATVDPTIDGVFEPRASEPSFSKKTTFDSTLCLGLFPGVHPRNQADFHLAVCRT